MRSLVAARREAGWTFEVDEVSTPLVGRGEVLVEVLAAGLAGDELEWSSSRFDPLGRERERCVPGREVAGRVVTLGHGAVGVEPGDHVFGWVEEGREGAFADYVVTRPERLASMPAGMDWVQAAGLPFAGAAAWQALMEHGRAAARDTVAVVGARTPVGRETIRIGRDCRLQMITSESWRGRSRDRRLDDVQLVVDTVGGRELVDAVEHLGPGVRVVSTVDDPPGRGLFFAPLVDRPRLRLLAVAHDPARPAVLPVTVLTLEEAATALPSLLGSDALKIVVLPRPLRAASPRGAGPD